MDVVKGLLSENEFRLFKSEDYTALENLLDDSLANQILNYINGEGQDPYVLDSIKCFLMPTIETLTFPLKLHSEGYVDMISKLSPQVIVSTTQDPEYIKKLHSQLRFLEANFEKITARTPARSRADYDKFLGRMQALVTRSMCENQELTYPNLIQRIEANKFVFYSPQDKGHSTMLGNITRRRREWTLCLRGLDYKEYCDASGIPANLRRVF